MIAVPQASVNNDGGISEQFLAVVSTNRNSNYKYYNHYKALDAVIILVEVYLDIRKAFDCVHYFKLLFRLP